MTICIKSKIVLSSERSILSIQPRISQELESDFCNVVMCQIVRSGSTLNSMLLDYFGYGDERPSKPAYGNQMKKIKDEFWPDFYRDMTKMITKSLIKSDSKSKGYRLVAIDGTDLAVPEYDEKNHTFSLRNHGQVSTHNSIHINAAVDVVSSVCVDVVLQHGDDMNEAAAAVEIIKNYDGPNQTIFVCDRGYPSYNLLANIIERGMYFLIRDGNSLGEYWWNKFAGEKKEGSITVTIRLTRSNATVVKNSELYHGILPTTTFDFLPDNPPFKQGYKVTSVDEIPEGYYYEMTFRVVKVKIGKEGGKNEYETLITNLPEEDFTPEELKKTYHSRWSIMPMSELLTKCRLFLNADRQNATLPA